MNPPIPFNRPYTTGREAELMADAVLRGHLSGDGHYTSRASDFLSQITGVPRVLLTTSCTHALEMAALLVGISAGDEVIMPSYTFVSCANAFVLRGAKPVFVDIRPDTYNIDETLIEASITERTKALVIVHYAGVACEMDAIIDLVDRHGLVLIEDTAHGLGATHRKRQLGSFAPLATLSFHETKNIQCGEGGALLISDPQLIERAEVLREKGTNRSRFFRGQVDKYTWVDVGSSYLPSDLLAAFLCAQLDEFESIQRQRFDVWSAYAEQLASWGEHRGFTLPFVPAGVEHAAHLFGMLAPSLEERQRFIAHLAAQEIKVVFHYVPLHSSPMGRTFEPHRDLPVTVDISERLVRLPLFAGLRPDELERVVDAVNSF